LNDFVKRFNQTGSITKKSGSGSPWTARTTANVDAVDELVLSLKQSQFGHASVRKDIISDICC